jgi:acetylornithine/N-succinyldiaminopimelate aminotransferase
MDIKELDREYIADTYSRADVLFVEGKGSYLYDEQGREYIDLGSGIAVNIFGAADDVWVNAVTRQLSKLQHASNLYYTEPQALLAKELCERTGMKKVFFGNSGAEANEAAIKAARKYSTDRHNGETGHNTIITLKNSFHGRTVTTLSATGQDVFHKDFTPFTGGFVYAGPNDTESVKKLIDENDCCAVMMELVQGEGGVVALDRQFVMDVAALCEDNGLLLIIDEVQTGNGRTGELYCYMNYGITPDIVTTAKGFGGGLPVGCVMLGEKVKSTFTKSSHGSTFGGNPVCAAGALSVIKRIDDELLRGVRKRSEYIINTLSGAKGVVSVSGLGLMLGIEPERPAKEVAEECIKRGVVCLTAKNKVRLLPALNVPFDALEKAVGILSEVLAG